MTLHIGQPPPGGSGQIQWVIQALFQIVRHLEQNDLGNIFDGYNLTGALTEQRSLDAGAGTTADTRAVLATLINDFRKRGSKGL